MELSSRTIQVVEEDHLRIGGACGWSEDNKYIYHTVMKQAKEQRFFSWFEKKERAGRGVSMKEIMEGYRRNK